VLVDAPDADTLLVASGSEVHIALAAQALLAQQGRRARVVSLPCWELFDAQPRDYRESVFPPSITRRVAVEAAASLGWERYTGSSGAIVALDHFGASAPYKTIYREFGLTPERVAAAALELA
jgi:transketolase